MRAVELRQAMGLRDEAAALGLADASLEPRAIAAPTASTAKGSAACRD